MEENISYTTRSIELESGDLIGFYTDGITGEALNDEIEEYGEKRLTAFLLEHRMLGADQIKNRLYDDILSYSRGSAQWDDNTFILLSIF